MHEGTPTAGIEPATIRLTAERSSAELSRKVCTTDGLQPSWGEMLITALTPNCRRVTGMAFAEVASSTYRKYIRLYGCYRRLESIFSVRRYRGERRENIAVGVPMTGGAPRQGLAMPPPHPPPPIHLITTAKPRHFIWHTDHPVWYVTHTIPYRICDVRYHYDTHTL